MYELDVVNVFVGPDGRGGNALGVVREGRTVPQEMRQGLAAEWGFSESLFVDDARTGLVDVYTPGARLPFAGHPLVGVAWLLRRQGEDVPVLRPPVGEVAAWAEGEASWIRARAEWATGRRTEQFRTVAEVDALPAPPPGDGWLYAWAWEDEGAGRVRARGFPRRGDNVVEDEATGAAALALTAELGRSLTVRQGGGSSILTRFHHDGTVDLGGRVRWDGRRPFAPAAGPGDQRAAGAGCRPQDHEEDIS
ncbi:putative PhzF superfamily epimerase YddE/YHI9 [Streptomyces olivoverticillatus]|uniref:Putative PhzF superfamily epimerase YddE/YHI9 n=1 Tax=Streptomyces olivoverticillatus TaxID=66427 RepID=A0A7W7LRQ4_9ACTN|nr:PhzF family phenazine biosynthesis protein [Streptomyces olivoverticillatus]MBB4895239.1 putative PhzF superfamily epimerase YddE/YHI9 [Streptomyces olivoverticillatus]